jgi:hypothetical protein
LETIPAPVADLAPRLRERKPIGGSKNTEKKVRKQTLNQIKATLRAVEHELCVEMTKQVIAARPEGVRLFERED